MENPVDTQYHSPEAESDEYGTPDEELEEQEPTERILESQSISISTDRSSNMRTFSSSSRAVNISNPSTRPRTYSSSSRAIERMSDEESEYSDAGNASFQAHTGIGQCASTDMISDIGTVCSPPSRYMREQRKGFNFSDINRKAFHLSRDSNLAKKTVRLDDRQCKLNQLPQEAIKRLNDRLHKCSST